jgi:hypothetical protein
MLGRPRPWQRLNGLRILSLTPRLSLPPPQVSREDTGRARKPTDQGSMTLAAAPDHVRGDEAFHAG